MGRRKTQVKYYEEEQAHASLMSVNCPNPADVGKAVEAYNDEPDCGEEDKWCWEKTASARELILGSNRSRVTPKDVIDYVETIRLWGSIQGVAKGDYPRAARVLWRDPVRNGIHGLKQQTMLTAPLDDVVRLEEALVSGMLESGIAKKHYSWASKMLHFLLPATMPIYDSVVLAYLEADDGIDGYREIAVTAQRCARELAPYETGIAGNIEPRTLVRALDKFYWWNGQRSRRR